MTYNDPKTPEIEIEFELKNEGQDKLTYREIYPRGVVGSFYISRVAALFKWGKIPPRIKITIEVDDQP